MKKLLPSTVSNKTPLAEAKKAVPSPVKQVAPFGVDDPQGHVMRRIQQAKPTVWNKIKNWD